MGYLVRNGKIYQQLVGVYGDVHLWYVGEAPPKTAYSLALSIMRKYEGKGLTDCPAYRYAQRVASCKLVDMDTSSNFIRRSP